MTQPIKHLFKHWDELVTTFPEDLESSVRQYGALHRRRGICRASDLLRLLLIYTFCLSLRSTAIWGVGLGLCDISRQALAKRIHQSTPWLRYLVTSLLRTLFPLPPGAEIAVQRLRLHDASTISRPGSPGTEWQVHLNWAPFQHQPAQVTLTDAHQGETLALAELQAGDLVVADRRYGIWREIQVALTALAYFIIRLTWSNLPLQTLSGQPFDLVTWLQSWSPGTEHAEITVVATNDPERRPLRLVAGRLPAAKAAEARERVRDAARKKHRAPHPTTLLVAGFCMVLTNLPAATWSTLQVLATYRVRWQVEWCFRRWKSLCQLDVLPAYPSTIAEPVLLAKLLLLLWLQYQVGTLPWAQWWADDAPPVAVSPLIQAGYRYLQELIQPAAVIVQLWQDPTPFLRHLRTSRRTRPEQLAAAACTLAAQLTRVPAPSPP